MEKKQRQVLLALENYDAEMHKGAADYALKHNWNLQVVSPSYGAVYRFWSGDGIISCADINPANEMTNFIFDFKGSKVEFGHPFFELTDHEFSCVYEDNEKIGQMAANYFVNKGFENFLYLSPHHFWHTDERGSCFVNAIRRCGYSAQECFLRDHITDMKTMFTFLGEYLQNMPKPLAVFCAQDSLSQWVIQGCRLADIRVPEDVAVLGTGNHKMVCEWGETPSSSIDTNLRFWGYSAAKLLDELIDGKQTEKSIKLIPPLKVVERISTNTTAVNDEAVSKAMRFIQENLNRPLSVEEVVDYTGTPKSSLIRKFRKTLNRSIVHEINRQKIEEAKRLLSDHTKNTVEVSGELGFSSPPYFYRVFKQETGMTTKEYRKSLFS